MSSTPSMMPPPPGAGNAPTASAAPTAPTAASPAPPSPSPALQHGTGMLLNVVSGLRAIAKAYPATSEKVAEANQIMREISAIMMTAQKPGEPQAPPS